MTKLVCLALLASGCLGRSFVAIEITPEPLELTAFSHLQLHAIGVRDDGSREDITDVVRWSSADLRVATISDTGTVEWVATGTTQIRATFYDLDTAASLRATGWRIATHRSRDVEVRRCEALGRYEGRRWTLAAQRC